MERGEHANKKLESRKRRQKFGFSQVPVFVSLAASAARYSFNI